MCLTMQQQHRLDKLAINNVPVPQTMPETQLNSPLSLKKLTASIRLQANPNLPANQFIHTRSVSAVMDQS
jgi:hypothetical protein